MSFTPFELSIREIFGEQRSYFIPNFQREFSWTKDNFDDFFIDLIESSDIKINESENTIDSDSSKYFFGMILLLGDKTSPKVDKPYEVIDGQQRLTTMTLFFAAILESIQIVNPKYVVDFYDRLIFDHASGGEKSYNYIKSLLTKENLIVSLNSKSNISMTKEEYVKCLEKLGVHLSNSTMICNNHNDRHEAHNLFRNLN